ncbi:MAG: hypothetical protein ACRCST_01555 [Turicibacter sp.]
MKTGKHYFGLLTEEEQRNFRQACSEGACYCPFSIIMKKQYENFVHFINDIDWFKSSQGYQYWSHIEVSTRTEQPKQPLATFRLIFIYSLIVFLVMCLLMVIHTASYKQGYKIGYRNGIEKVDSIVNYEELTTESVEAVQELQLNTMRDD